METTKLEDERQAKFLSIGKMDEIKKYIILNTVHVLSVSSQKEGNSEVREYNIKLRVERFLQREIGKIQITLQLDGSEGAHFRGKQESDDPN